MDENKQLAEMLQGVQGLTPESFSLVIEALNKAHEKGYLKAKADDDKYFEVNNSLMELLVRTETHYERVRADRGKLVRRDEDHRKIYAFHETDAGNLEKVYREFTIQAERVGFIEAFPELIQELNSWVFKHILGIRNLVNEIDDGETLRQLTHEQGALPSFRERWYTAQKREGRKPSAAKLLIGQLASKYTQYTTRQNYMKLDPVLCELIEIPPAQKTETDKDAIEALRKLKRKSDRDKGIYIQEAIENYEKMTKLSRILNLTD